MNFMPWGLAPKPYFLISCSKTRIWQTYELVKHKNINATVVQCVAITNNCKLIKMSLPLKVDDLRLLMSLYTKKARPSSITNAATTTTPR